MASHMSTPARTCPACQQPLPADAPQGLCPQCLAKSALGSQPGSEETIASGSKPGGAGPATIQPEIARLFPQLEILSPLGQGGMGMVYKARQPQLDRVVALKVMRADLSRDPAFAERFAREARALAKLNHPNIVSVFDFGQTGGHCWFLMEFVDGRNLRELLRTKTLTAREALGIVPRVCDALQFAHDEGIVHRDIKPENILLDKKGRVKIADFGLAKLVGKDASDFSLTATGMTLGTPRYMAPEQFDKPQEVDHRADIYSLGVVLYEMLTGEVPMGRFAPPSATVGVDVRLDEIVLRSLEKEPSRRYQHASEVKTQVESIAGMVANLPPMLRQALGFEYKSKTEWFGLSLVHIAYGMDLQTGKTRVAKGILAIGNVAKGVFAFGGAAYGGFAFGGLAVGVVAIGGLGIGLFSFAGLALALVFAYGGLAVAPVALGGFAAGYYACGGAAFGPHAVGGNANEPEARQFFFVVMANWKYLNSGSLLLMAVSFVVPFVVTLWARRQVPQNPADTGAGRPSSPASEAVDQRISQVVTVGLPGWFHRRASWMQFLLQIPLVMVVAAACLAMAGSHSSFRFETVAGERKVQPVASLRVGQPSPWLTAEVGGPQSGFHFHPLAASVWVGLAGIASMSFLGLLRRTRPGADAVKAAAKQREWWVVVTVAVVGWSGLGLFHFFHSVQVVKDWQKNPPTAGKPSSSMPVPEARPDPAAALISKLFASPPEVRMDKASLPATTTPGRRDFAFSFNAPPNHVLNAWLEFWKDGKVKSVPEFAWGYAPVRGDAIRAGLLLTTQDGDMAGVGSAGQMRFDWALTTNVRGESLRSKGTASYGHWRTNVFKEIAARGSSTSQLSWDDTTAPKAWQPKPGEVATVLAWTAHAGKSVSSTDLKWTEESLRQGVPAVAILLRVRFDPVSPEQLRDSPTTSTSIIDVKKLGPVPKLPASPPQTNAPQATTTDAADLLRQMGTNYGSLKSLNAVGKVTAVTIPAAGGASQTNVTTFNLNLARPEFYRVMWTNRTGWGAVWSAGDGHRVLPLVGSAVSAKVVSMLNREQATATAASSWGIARTVPELFFKDEPLNLVRSLSNPVLNGEEVVEGEACHVIASESPTTKATVWVRKSDLLLKQYRSEPGADAGKRVTQPVVLGDEDLGKILKSTGQAATPDAIANLRKQMTEGKERAGAARTTFTQTYLTQKANGLMIREDFEVKVPGAAAAKQRK